MKNSFSINVDKYLLRSTDDYHIIAEIVLSEDETPILQWYREEYGFTFKFLSKKPFAKSESEIRNFINLFRILIDIISLFMLEEGTSMKFSRELVEDFPMLTEMMQEAGLEPLEENFNKEVDSKEPLEYNDEEDEYWMDDYYDEEDDIPEEY